MEKTDIGVKTSEESPASEQDPKTSAGVLASTEPSLADVAQQAHDKATQAETEDESKKSDASNEDEAQESQGQALAKTEKKEGKQEEGKESNEKKDETTEGKEKESKVEQETEPEKHEPIPYSRFAEVNKAKTEYEDKIKAIEPDAKWAASHRSFCGQYGITQEDFASAMNILALQKTDPAKARELLKPIWEQLQEFDENALPADLKKEVEEGALTEAAAKRIAKAEASVRRDQHIGKFQAQQRHQAEEAAKGNAIKSWDESRRNTDPDFRPKTNATDPNGLWEMTASQFAYLQTIKFAKTPQEIVAQLEQAYNDAKGTLSHLVSRASPNTRKTLTTSRSSGSPKKRRDEMTTADVVSEVAASHGIDWSPRGESDDD